MECSGPTDRRQATSGAPTAESEAPAGLSNLEALRGMRSWTVSSAFAAAYTAITAGAYNTGYALHLGASTAQVGLLSAAAAWGQTLQLLSPLLIERLPQRKRLCLWTYALSYGMWLPIAALPWLLPASLRPLGMILLVAIGGAAAATASPASTSWLGDLVPARMRARFVSRQQMGMAAVGLAASLLAGRYLDAFPADRQQVGFTTIFVVAVGFAFAAVVAWARVPEAPRPRTEPVKLPSLLLLPLRNPNVRNLTAFIAMRTAVVMIAAPFFAVYMLKQLGIPYSLIAVFSGLSTIAIIAANPVWAYLSDKFGHRPVLHIAAFGLGFVPVTWFFTTKQNYLIVTPTLMVWSGLMSAGVILAQFNLLVKLAPEEHRSVYIGFHSAVVSAASALGAMAGGALGGLFGGIAPLHVYGHELTNLHFVFAVSAVGRFGCLVLLPRVGEERATSARDLIGQVGGGLTLGSAWSLYRMTHSPNPTAKAQSARALGIAHSRLAVEELIASLDDSDWDVRREAARALGEIGDERAVEPLLRKARDEASGISLGAMEALGHLSTPQSREFLLRQLESGQPAVREVAAAALGSLGVPEAAEPLARLLDREPNPTVTLAAARALGKTGGAQALARLRELLKEAHSDLARRELATAIGDLIGRPGRLYKLLQADPMREEETVERVLQRSRRRLGALRGMAEADRHYAAEELADAAGAFVQGEYAELMRVLLRVVSRAVKLALPALPSSGADAATMTVRDVLALDEPLQLSYTLLAGLARDARREPPSHEDALLAIIALPVAIHRLERLTRR